MEQRTLELELVSAKDVKHVNLISKMSIYAVVSISGDPYVNNPMQNTTKTNLVRKCGTNPSFNNFPIRFTLNDSLLHTNRLSLHVSLLSKRTLLADTPVGSLHVSIKDLLESSSTARNSDSGGAMQIASYQLRRPSGRPHGELSFRYNFGEKVTVEMTEIVKKSTEPVTAYPVGEAAPYAKESTSSSAYPAPLAGYAYPPVQPGYAYPVAQPGYGYPPATAPVKQPKKKNNNNDVWMGVAAGFLGGYIIGEALENDGGGCGGGGCGGGGCGGGGCGGGGCGGD